MDHFIAVEFQVSQKRAVYSFHFSKFTSKHLTSNLHVELESSANIFFSKSKYIQKEDGSLKFANTEHVSSLHDNCQML